MRSPKVFLLSTIIITFLACQSPDTEMDPEPWIPDFTGEVSYTPPNLPIKAPCSESLIGGRYATDAIHKALSCQQWINDNPASVVGIACPEGWTEVVHEESQSILCEPYSDGIFGS